MRRLRILVPVLLGALALSSCTLVSPNATPVRIPNSKVGLQLLSPTIPGTNGAHVRFNTQAVYIVDATGQLSPSSRIVPTPAALSTVIQQLLLGPSAIERSVGDSSALPTAWYSSRPRFITRWRSQLRDVPSFAATGQGDAGHRSTRSHRRPGGGHERHRDQGGGVIQSLPTPSGKSLKLVTPQDFESLLDS